MVETFTSRIKASNLAEMFVLTYSLIRNIAAHENRPLVQIDSLARKFIFQFYMISIYSKGMTNMKKMFISKTILVFNFTSAYQIVSESIHRQGWIFT